MSLLISPSSLIRFCFIYLEVLLDTYPFRMLGFLDELTLLPLWNVPSCPVTLFLFEFINWILIWLFLLIVFSWFIVLHSFTFSPCFFLLKRASYKEHIAFFFSFSVTFFFLLNEVFSSFVYNIIVDICFLSHLFFVP